MMKYLYKISLILTFFISFIVMLSLPVPLVVGGGEPPGAPASPIDDYIIYLAIVGLFVIYYTYKNQID